MVLKLLVFMVALAVLEGIAGLQEEQFANETQIEANPDHKKRGGRRLDKLPCIIEDGTCQRIGEPCDGVVRRGPEWCLHDRHFECCYPYGCEMDGVVCPNGAIAEKHCIILICLNGCWVYEGWNPDCGICYTNNKTNIVPYVSEGYMFPGPRGVYHFSGGFGRTVQPFGIDVCFIETSSGEYCIEYVFYYEPGVTIYIIPIGGVLQICVEWFWGPCVPFVSGGICTWQAINTGFRTVFIYLNTNWAYIIGSYGLSVYVDYTPPDAYLLNVYSMATPRLQGNLYGLCDEWTNVPTYPPGDYTDSNGVVVTGITPFVPSWKIPLRRKRDTKDFKQSIMDHTLHVTDPTIIEKSMNDIVKSCEEINEGPCSVLSCEECEILQETCVSRMSNVEVPGQGGSSDSSE